MVIIVAHRCYLFCLFLNKDFICSLNNIIHIDCKVDDFLIIV
jgi:hypothetical protein